MAAKDGLGQGGMTDHAPSPYEARRQLDPMGAEEAEAFDWVIKRLAGEDPEADFRALCDDGLDQGWFVLGDEGELRVNPEPPEGAL